MLLFNSRTTKMRLLLPVDLLRGGFQGLPSRSGKCLLHLLGEQAPHTGLAFLCFSSNRFCAGPQGLPGKAVMMASVCLVPGYHRDSASGALPPSAKATFPASSIPLFSWIHLLEGPLLPPCHTLYRNLDQVLALMRGETLLRPIWCTDHKM